MPLVGLGVLILWLGWFGFNGGSTLGTSGSRFAEVMLVTQLGAAAGVIGACLVTYFKTRSLDVGMAGNGAIAGLVGITAPSGYVEFWAAPIIGLVAGILVVYAVLAIEKKLDDPVGALSAHGLPASGARSRAACSPPPGSPSSTASATRACSTRAPSSSSACRRVGVGAAFAHGVRALVRSRSGGSRRRSGCASTPRPRKPASTSPSTACTATRSSSSRSRSCSAAAVPADGRRHADRAGAQPPRAAPPRRSIGEPQTTGA